MPLSSDLWRVISHPRGTWQGLHRWSIVARYARLPYADIMHFRRELRDNAPFQRHLAQALPDVTYGFPGAAELYTIVRAARPATIVETGVASGMSSAHILEALAMNGVGTLHSLDLPNVQAGSVLPDGRATGWIVPHELRARWTLHIGDARELLPRLLGSLPRVDLFMHDSDHSYEHMSFEFDLAVPRIAPGGLLLSDDTHLHSAWQDALARHNLRGGRVGALGIARKPISQ